MKKMMALFLLLSACASLVTFKKNGTEMGYKVTDGPTKDVFSVQLNLNKTLDDKTLARYIGKAVGEECQERGFDYFDVAENGTSADGFCFKENVRMSLGVTFNKEGLDQQPQKFIIDNLNSKSKTNFKLGDIVTKVAGINTTTLGALRSITFKAGASGVTSLPLEVKRNGKTVKFEEPIAAVSGGANGPKELLSLRQTVE